MKLLLASIAFVAGFAPGGSIAQFFNDFDQPPHDYWTAPMSDPMSVLVRRIESGEVKIDEEPGRALVKRVLDELDIPLASQVMVFSRTSLQRGAMSASNPRAIYFNEDSYLGWMPGGRIEIASSDPDRGAVFFFQRKLDQRDGPMFFRDRVCIQCHAGSATNFLPGLLARSVYPDSRGRSMKSVDSFERVGHEVPLHDRWGGWYVTGGHAGLQHMGNALASRGADGVEIDRKAKASLADLDQFFDPDKYLYQGSDIVALLVLDHQISMHFELMEAQYIVRQLIADAGWKDGEIPGQLPEEFAKELRAAARRVVEYLLFKDEAPLGEGHIAGNGEFRKIFAAGRRADAKGRSLKDFHLHGRIFEHRCSYMIYSRSFDALTPILKTAVLDELKLILAAPSAPEGYEYLGDDERKAIAVILSETLPAYKS